MKKPLLFLIILTQISFPSLLQADIQFSDYTLSGAGSLLFSADCSSAGLGTYKTLFLTDIKAKKTVQLTFFPEAVQYLGSAGVFQIQNRFGVFRSDSNLKNFSALSAFPAFVNGKEIQQGKIVPVSASPDGKYLVYCRALSDVFGSLVLYDVAKAAETIVSEKMPLSFGAAQTAWAPDSKTFVYAKESKLYFYSIDHLENNRTLAETYRNFAAGALSSVQWSTGSSLYLIDGSLVIRIESAELFARALYAGSVSIGTIVGKIPFDFTPSLDRFWLSPDGKKILINKSQQSVFFFFLVDRDYASQGTVKSLPHLFLPRSMTVQKILWSSADQITILSRGIEKGNDVRRIFRLTAAADNTAQCFTQAAEQDVIGISLSEDEKTVLLLRADRIDLYNNASWKKEGEIAFPGALHALWKSKTEVIIAGSKTIELYDTAKKTLTLIALSQPEESGFSTDGTSVLAKNSGKIYTTRTDTIEWKTIAAFSVSPQLLTTADFRVYAENIESGSYKNMLMLRDLKGLTTSPLFTYSKLTYEEFPASEDAIDFTYFNHGSRIRRREVAIVFNAVYGTEGLSTVLTVLKEYGIKCTFFVNGEFIRRYPDAVKEIADSGHEIASLFYAFFDMTDARYSVDADFIKKGLARNEDEYFQATGKELSLLWHTPFYFTNSTIIEASRQMNYAYVGRDVDPLDWVGKNAPVSGGTGYFSSPLLVERILAQKKPGSIIPIELGIPAGGRDDYLFQYLDVLLDALTRLGYGVVTVSGLIEHAR